MIKVGINGYGTIGKRVAEAVTLQDDMEIVGIVKTKPTYGIIQVKDMVIRIIFVTGLSYHF